MGACYVPLAIVLLDVDVLLRPMCLFYLLPVFRQGCLGASPGAPHPLTARDSVALMLAHAALHTRAGILGKGGITIVQSVTGP